MRVCFRSSVKPSQIPEYRRRHAAVWPEMLRELKAAGWNNYSLFLADDGLLVGYVEMRRLRRSARPHGLTEVNARWQAEMAALFEDELRRRPGLPPAHRNFQSRGPVVRGQCRRRQPQPQKEQS